MARSALDFPLGFEECGCGGSQPAEFGVLLDCSVCDRSEVRSPQVHIRVFAIERDTRNSYLEPSAVELIGRRVVQQSPCHLTSADQLNTKPISRGFTGVLVALRDKLMRRDPLEDFCREYVRELNRLRMEHRAGLSSARTELAVVDREIRKLVQAIKDGVSAMSIKDELLSLEARKVELQSRPDAPEMPGLLHLRMADVYREKVGRLCLALEKAESRTGAVEAIRYVDRGYRARGRWQSAQDHAEGRPGRDVERGQRHDEVARNGDLMDQIKLVAGACSRLHRWFSTLWPPERLASIGRR